MSDEINLSEESVIQKERRLKLKKAREAIGKSPEEMAFTIGISIPAYYDLEECNGDLNIAITLSELSKLSSVLGIDTATIFEGKLDGKQVSPEQLCGEIRGYLNRTRISISEFEDRVGYAIEPCLRDSTKILDWNVDCLQAVCDELDIDWHLALL